MHDQFPHDQLACTTSQVLRWALLRWQPRLQRRAALGGDRTTPLGEKDFSLCRTTRRSVSCVFGFRHPPSPRGCGSAWREVGSWGRARPRLVGIPPRRARVLLLNLTGPLRRALVVAEGLPCFRGMRLGNVYPSAGRDLGAGGPAGSNVAPPVFRVGVSGG